MKRHIPGIVLVAALAACGGSEVGEACDEVGSLDACADGAICTNQSGGDDEAVCRTVCDDQDDCGEDEACNGVSGSDTKSCQPDDGK